MIITISDKPIFPESSYAFTRILCCPPSAKSFVSQSNSQGSWLIVAIIVPSIYSWTSLTFSLSVTSTFMVIVSARVDPSVGYVITTTGEVISGFSQYHNDK